MKSCVSIRLDKEVFSIIQHIAAEKKESLSVVLREVISEGIAVSKALKRRHKKSKNKKRSEVEISKKTLDNLALISTECHFRALSILESTALCQNTKLIDFHKAKAQKKLIKLLKKENCNGKAG